MTKNRLNKRLICEMRSNVSFCFINKAKTVVNILKCKKKTLTFIQMIRKYDAVCQAATHLESLLCVEASARHSYLHKMLGNVIIVYLIYSSVRLREARHVSTRPGGGGCVVISVVYTCLIVINCRHT